MIANVAIDMAFSSSRIKFDIDCPFWSRRRIYYRNFFIPKCLEIGLQRLGTLGKGIGTNPKKLIVRMTGKQQKRRLDFGCIKTNGFWLVANTGKLPQLLLGEWKAQITQEFDRSTVFLA